MQKATGLNDCPFCGSSNLSVVGSWLDFTILCHDCEAEGPKRTEKDQAKKAWDTRVDSQG